MRDWQSQTHVKHYCKYHVVIVPKYRKKAIYGALRRDIGKILRELCCQQGVELVEGYAMRDYIHMLLMILQQCLRDQQEAFKNFWAGRAKYLSFKKKTARQSIRLTKAAFNMKGSQLFIAKSKEPLAIKWSRERPSEPSSVTISKDKSGRYFVSMLCEFESKPMPVCDS
uniref:transposase n=1 Tax=Endozoicomonas sp. Mp262 TaxID=2919499 RepID=UPI00351AC6B4